MSHRTIGLYLPWKWNLAQLAPTCNPLTKYRRAVEFKANRRDESYMRALLTERFPDGEFINIDQDRHWRKILPEADTVVLLYPDAIGLGFSPVERAVGRLKKNWAAIRVLNGRRRDFLLNTTTLWALRLRRTIEWGMLGEILALLLFAGFTPFLLLRDLMRGRK